MAWWGCNEFVDWINTSVGQAAFSRREPLPQRIPLSYQPTAVLDSDLLGMTQPDYTTIPDTSDSTYWEVQVRANQLRSTTFVPRDKELHLQLKKKAWATIQASLGRNRRR